MGFKKPDLRDAYNSISNSLNEINSNYNDGFTAWTCKKDLYKLKFFLDQQLKKSAHFGSYEEEFLKKHEQELMWKILKQ